MARKPKQKLLTQIPEKFDTDFLERLSKRYWLTRIVKGRLAALEAHLVGELDSAVGVRWPCNHAPRARPAGHPRGARGRGASPRQHLSCCSDEPLGRDCSRSGGACGSPEARGK